MAMTEKNMAALGLSVKPRAAQSPEVNFHLTNKSTIFLIDQPEACIVIILFLAQTKRRTSAVSK